MTDPQFLEMEDRRIAYHRVEAKEAGRPGIVFLGGFRSDMQGTKARFLDQWARERGRAFLRFDYTGHGQSSGRFEDGTIGDWARDARMAISHLTQGPQIFVGSSMGGWISLILARVIPERIAGLVCIAAAPDFTEESRWANLSDAQRDSLLKDGQVNLHRAYTNEPYVITRRLIDDGRRHSIFQHPLAAAFPIRLLQGMKDPDVPWQTAARLAEHITGPDIRVTLLPDGDHRLSTPSELRIIGDTLDWLDRDASAIGNEAR